MSPLLPVDWKNQLVNLKAFAKTKLLQPGESEILIFNVSDYDLASFDESIQSWVSAKENIL